MQLSLYTDYALRVLIYLCVHQDRLSSINQIASCYNISQNHLMKVVHNLGKAGFITTVRGRRGGLRLNREPSLMTLGSIVRLTEETDKPVKCGTCVIHHHCAIQPIIIGAFEAFYNILDQYTLDCITEDYERLFQIFTIKFSENLPRCEGPNT